MVGKMIRILLFFAVLPLSVEVHAADYTFRSGYGLEFSWLTDDRVGITTGNSSYGVTEQLSFWTSKTAVLRNERSLYAVGYQLKPGTTYYSYSPYKWKEGFDARTIECRYDKQSQNGNGSTAALASCDYQMASALTSSTACTFSYKHIGGVLRVSFRVPSAMTVEELKITTETPTLATTAVMDIIDQKVTLGGYAAALTLKTENISVANGGEVVLYLFIPAQNLSSTKLTISAKDGNSNNVPLATILGPNVKAGRLYDISLNGQSRAAARTLQNVNNETLQNVNESDIQRVAGIANPLARAEDILLDKSYSVQYVQAVKKGDVNGDGEVDVLDAIALIGYYTKGRTSELSTSVCDMNNDGDIDVLDAIEIVGRYTKGGS